MYEATAEKRKPASSITPAMTAAMRTSPVTWRKMKKSGMTDATSAMPIHCMGASRSVRGREVAPSSRIWR